MPAAWAAGGASLLSGYTGMQAAGQQEESMDDLLRFQKRVYREGKERYDPYLKSGKTALDQYMSQLGLGDQPAYDVTQLPGYQQSLTQGINAINQGAAGSGMLMSGERLKGLQSEGQNVFGNYYSDYMNRLQGMQGQGYNAAQSLSSFAGGMAAQMAPTYEGIGNARAGQWQAMGQGLSGGLGAFSGSKIGGGGGGGVVDPNQFNFSSLYSGGGGGF